MDMLALRNRHAFEDKARKLWGAKVNGKKKPAVFTWTPLSRKQKQVMLWWEDGSPHKDKTALICDGAVRAGKTVCMSFSYVKWAMKRFNLQTFGISGKTVLSCRRNVIEPLKKVLKGRGYKVKEKRTDNLIIIKKGKVTNLFYIFGGKDESSQDLIQGITLAGMFFDEVALMPQSFVNQATARCSVAGSKFVFNCNPAGPFHWFKKEWLDNLEKKNALHIHFRMHDNPSLTQEKLDMYESLYTGVFYRRYILGLWVAADGIIYDNFDSEIHVVGDDDLPERFDKMLVGIDYGTSNATSFLLVGVKDGVYYIVKEYYYSGRTTQRSKSDMTYSKDLQAFIEGYDVWRIFIDPSAASFITQLKDDNVQGIYPADHDVLNGIRTVQSMIDKGRLKVHKSCVNLISELSSYAWCPKAQKVGEDKPIKENDHACDALRYVILTDAGMSFTLY
jgi:PBSX family phage terminase large subunit